MKFFWVLLFVTVQCFASQEWQEEKDFYEKRGFLWVKHFFSPEQVRLLKDWAEKVNTAAESLLALDQPLSLSLPGIPIIVPESNNPSQACRAEDLLTCYPDLYHFIEGTVTNFLGQLLGEPYVLFKDKLNFKWPGGGAFPPHQDFPAFELFGPREHVTAMVCIDPATLENGCLQVAENWRQTFKGDPKIDPQKLEEGSAVLPYVIGGSMHGSIQPEYCEKINWLPLKTEPGDLVLISSFVPHYSEVNQSDSSRRAMFFTLNKLQEGDYRRTYYQTKRNDPENPVFHFATPTKARGK